MNEVLKKYLKKFRSLRQGVTQYGPAPHKPVLLLAVIRGFEQDVLTANRIALTPELVGFFRSVWQTVVITDHVPLIAQPFFYLRSEKFWHHVGNPGYEKWSGATKDCKSIGVLNETVAYAQLDDALFQLMLDPVHREVLKQALLARYFPDAKSSVAYDYLDDLELQMVASDSASYRASVRTLLSTLDKAAGEEEIFVRGGLFKRKIPQIYQNSCCISRLCVESTLSASLVDACHIVPFSESYDDTISNGLALCPTLHRAFDRGLIAVEPETYRVRISKQFSEIGNSVYSLQQFAGQRILLPENPSHQPSQENLQKHLDRFAVNF